MKKHAGLALACAILILVTGCKPNPETRLLGTWTFQGIQSKDAPAAAVSSATKQFSNATATFGKDKSFVLQVGGQSQVVGTWTLADHAVTIVVSTIHGKTSDQMKGQIATLTAQYPQLADKLNHLFDPITGALSADGKTFSMSNAGQFKAAMTFTKPG